MSFNSRPTWLFLAIGLALTSAVAMLVLPFHANTIVLSLLAAALGIMAVALALLARAHLKETAQEENAISRLEAGELSLDKQARLNQVIMDITDIVNVEEMILAATRQGVNLVDGEMGAIAYWSSDEQQFKIKASYNWPEDALLLPLSDPWTVEVLRNESYVLDEPDQLFKIPSEAAGSYGQTICAPISYGLDFLGVIIIVAGKEGRLSADAQEMITILARVTSPAIANSDLFSQLAKVVDQMIVVNDISQNLSSYLDLDELLTQIAGKVNKLMGTNAAFVHVWDEARRVFRVGASVGFTSPAPILRPVTYGEGLIGWIAKNNQLVELSNVKDSAYLGEVGTAQDFTFLLAVPILARDRVIGVIGCLADRPSRPDESDVTLLLSLANTTAISIENAWLYAQTQELARVDGLTGLLNYRELQRFLDEEIERSKRYKNSFALLMMDVDNFKDYNDNNGHDEGDDALRLISEVIGNSCRRLDKAFRYGGEEFCILLLDTTIETALIIAERVRRQIDTTVFKGQKSQPSGNLTISIGIAIFPDDADKKKTLTRRADQALYQAKKMGRNRVETYRGDVAA